ncbi:hypothetical protein BJV77DRAFT_1146287 [Russula vinacea]|nr:hypothetical protein BJV77DRAFT_1146287 [Russula vinacea]
MQSLLRWSIENSSSDVASPPTRRTDLDPGVIDAILGRPDSELMKEALAKAQDASLDGLIENIDNANDLEKLGMWEPLQDLLASPSDDVKVQALWVIGTAVQNNPAAQKAYLAIDPLPTILSYLSRWTLVQKLRSKAIYTLSGLLKHKPLHRSVRGSGWVGHTARCVLRLDIGVRRKAAFLLNSLLTPSSPASAADPPVAEYTPAPTSCGARAPNSHASMLADPTSVDTATETLRALRAHGLLPVLVRELTEPTPYGPDGDEGDGCDADLEEKLIRLLHTYVSAHDGTFDGPEKTSLRTFFDAKRVTLGEGELGLGADELRGLRNALV